MINKILSRHVLVFFVFFGLSIYITYPLIFHLEDFVTGFGDELIITWIQNWIIHALFTNPFGLFDTNLFFPYNNTLVYSDLYLTTSILSIIPLRLLGEPIVTFNFTVLSSLALVPFSVFVLSWYLTKDYFASILSGFLVLFAPAFLDKKVHVQALALEWIPLSVLFFIVFHKQKKARYLIISMFFFLLQTYNSFMPGYFLIFFYFVYVIYLSFRDKSFFHFFLKKVHVLILLATLALIIPIILPYYKASNDYGLKRDIRDAIHFAIQPEDLLYPNEHTRLQNYLLSLPLNQRSQNDEFKSGYLGFVFTLLSVVAIFYFIKNFKKNGIFINSLVTTSLVGLILSFGPALHLGRQTIHYPFPIPLPYALFYYILPGFQGFRNSARFEMMFILFIAIVIAIILSRIFKRRSFVARCIIYTVLIVGVIVEHNYPMKFYPVPQKKEFPAVYHWLNTTPSNSASIIMPIYNWYMYGSSEEMKRDYYSTVNWRRTVNGASGFAPPQWERLVAKLHANFPDKATIRSLKELDINYVIVDKEAFDREFYIKQQSVNGTFVINTLKHELSLRFIKSFKNYFVFEFVNNYL